MDGWMDGWYHVTARDWGCGENEGRKVGDVTAFPYYQHFMADDYTWASADGSYFYYAWCDRSDTYTSGGHSRPDPNIRLGKIKQ